MTHSKKPEEAALSRKVPTDALPLSPAEHREGRMHQKAAVGIKDQLCVFGLYKLPIGREPEKVDSCFEIL
jgi:hypothetical protein